MKRTFLALGWILALLAPIASRAAVFERDWKTPGDGLLTYDDVNRREWLDVPLSLLSQFSGDSLEDKYQSVVAETSVGSLFEGFAVGKTTDVFALAQSAGIDTSTFDLATNQESSQLLLEFLGRTFVSSSGDAAFLWGKLNDVDTNLNLRLFAALGVGSRSAGISTLVGSGGVDKPASLTGVFLYRAAIPEPSAFALLSGCLLSFMAAFRSRRRIPK